MKLELRENMYIRTKKGIAKIKKIFLDGSEPYFEAKYETDTYLEIYYDSEYVSEYNVLKASYNIIDILEVGDYVNGHEIKDIDYAFDDIALNEKKPRIVPYIDNIKNAYIDNIKSVITHEQMEQMAYKVEE